MTAFTVPADKNFDTFLGASVNATLDTYAVNGARLTIDTDTRYCASRAGTASACTGSLDTFTISAALGGEVYVDGTSVRIVPYKSGSGTTPTLAPALAITAAAWASSVVTITTATHSYTTGDWVAIGGLEPNAYNGVYQVTVTAATTFTYELAADPGISTITNAHAVKYFTIRQTLVAGTAITAGSWSSSVTTVTANGHGLVTNDWVLITGVTPTTYNGYWLVTGYTTNTFTFTQLVTPGAWSSGGTATKTVQGYFLGCWSTFAVAPIPLGIGGAGTVPGTGYIKFKGKKGGNFTTGTLTIQGGTAPAATSISQDFTGWIEVVGPETGLATVPRLGKFTAAGDWFYPRTVPKTSTTITNATTTATLTLVAHGVTADSIITITGATPAAYNGTFTVATVPTADTLTYTMLSNPGGNASVQGNFTTQICTNGVAGQQIQLPASLANTYYGGAWIEKSAPISSTYTWVANVVTVTQSAHGYVAGGYVTIDFTTGGATADAEYLIASVTDANTYTFALTGSGTAGNCTATSFEYYASAGSLVAANSISTNTNVGKVCWISSQGLLRIGSDGTNTNGFLPSSGLKIRVPNIITMNTLRNITIASGANALPNVALATRYEFATSGGGVINMDKINIAWYMLFAQAYSLTLTNVAIHDQLNISELASPIALRNVGVSPTAATLFNPLLMSLCFAGGTMTNVSWNQATAQGTGNYGVSMTDIFGLTITNETTRLLIFRAHATTGVGTYLRVNNTTWTGSKTIGGRSLFTTCTNLTFTTNSYCDRIDNTATTTTFTHYAFDLTANCNTITVDGLNFFGLANRNPYLGLMAVQVGTSNVKLRNVGTAASPLNLEASNGCAYVIASAAGAGCTDIELKRVYTSTPRTGMQNFDNSISGVIYESVWAGSSTLTTGLPIASLNTQARGLINGYYPQTNIGQGAVYGTHFMDYFDYSTSYSAITAGEIIIAANEKTGDSPSASTYTADSLSATSGFNSVGVLQIPTLADQVTWTSPTKIIGHTAFRAELPALVGPTTITRTLSAGTWSGGTMTITTTTVHKLAAGDTIVISATVPVLFNGTFVIATVPSTTTATYKMPTTPGAWSSGGTVTVPYLEVTAGSWSANFTSLTIGTHGLAAGDTITVVGTNPVAYSGTFVITNIVSATVVRYAQTPTPGAWVSGGTVRVTANIDLYYDYNVSGTFKPLRVQKKDCAMASTGNGIITMADTSGLAVDDYIFGDGVGTSAKISSISTNVSVTANVNNASVSTWPRTCYFNHLPIETVPSASAGFDLKVRAKTNANSNTAAITYIDVPTTATSTSIAYQYPLDLATITLSNLVVGSVYEIYNVSSSTTLATGTAASSTVSVSAVASNGQNIRVRVRKSSAVAKYLPFETNATVAALAADIYVSQVADDLIANSVSGTIAGDFTISTTNKTIRHVLGETPIYTVNELYTYLLDYIDDEGTIQFYVPMSAQTPSEYTLINGWFIDDESVKFLSGGAIQTSGWTSGGIRLKSYNATGAGVAFSVTDIGKIITETDTSQTGTIVHYDERTATEIGYVWIRPTTGSDTFADVNSAYTVASSSAIGVFSAASTSGENIYSNIFSLGSLVAGTTLDVYQNDIQITPWWTSGQIDILVKVKESGTEIDSGNVTVLARLYGTLYDHYLIDASTGRNPVPLAAFDDGNNDTASGTVAAYTGITFDFGYYSGDLSNGNGPRPYDVVIDCGGNTILKVYEYLKYITRTGSATTFTGYGTVPGEYYTAVGDIRLTYSGLASGPFGEGNLITSSSGGSGYIVSLFAASSILVIRNVHGTFLDTNTITSGATTATISGVPDTITASKQAPFGTYAGGQFFAARGVWIFNMHSNDANNYTLIDSTNTTQDPPASISIVVNGVVSGDRVSVFRAVDGDTSGNINKSYLTSHASSNTAGLGTFTVTTTIPADTPATGRMHIVNTAANIEQHIRYASWTTTAFTFYTAVTGTITAVGDVTGRSFYDTNANLSTIKSGDLFRNTSDGSPGSWAQVITIENQGGDDYYITHTPLRDGTENDWDVGDGYSFHTLPIAYGSTDKVYVPYIDETATGTSVSKSVIYVADRNISTQVRRKGIIPFNSNSITLTASGYTATAVRTTDSIVT